MRRRVHRFLWIALGLVSLVLVLGRWFLFTPHRAGREVPLETALASLGLEPEQERLARAFLALESREQEIRRLHFPGESALAAWDEILASGWDALNQGGSLATAWPLAPDATLHFETAADPIPSDGLPPGVSVMGMTSVGRKWGRSEWRDWVTTWEREGWFLARSEWRLSGASWDRERARVELEVDWKALVARKGEDADSRRVQATGRLLMEWDDRVDQPLLRRVRLREGRVLGRTGQPLFELVYRGRIPDVDGRRFADPVLSLGTDPTGGAAWLFAGVGQVLRRDAAGAFRWERWTDWPREPVVAAALADVDRDGREDLLVAGREGLRILWGRDRGDGDGWRGPGEWVWKAPEPLRHPQCLTVGDVTGDGWPDVWLGQYKLPYQGGQFPTPYHDALDGFPGYLLVHPGPSGGLWTDATQASGLETVRLRRQYSASWLDVNGDRHLDWVGISDFAGLDVWLNDGAGRFHEVTPGLGVERHGFGMGHVIGDFSAWAGVGIPPQPGASSGRRPSVWMIGMDSPVARRLDALGEGHPDFPEHARLRAAMTVGNRMFLGSDEGLESVRVPDLERGGWAWGGSAVDLANRGRDDFWLANGHETRASTLDYEPHFWVHDIHVAGSGNDPVRDAFYRAAAGRRAARRASYGGWYNQNLFWGHVPGRFVELGWLLGTAWGADGRHTLAEDMDGDGRVDLLLTTSEEWPDSRQEVLIWRNVWTGSGRWIGFWFPEGTGDRSLLQARVDITFDGTTRSAWLSTGDGYRIQRRLQVHFGLGPDATSVQAQVNWPDGSNTLLGELPVDQWHAVPRR